MRADGVDQNAQTAHDLLKLCAGCQLLQYAGPAEVNPYRRWNSSSEFS
ncbi:protein of unknown function [Methylocaldum szegediense]|uniref:Uncharacterized protein n=1 Tax=Methylocaldum szegediense TaxID=73780 RepID=A0ABM9HZ53_9GAMM|nr:protein of unknown function [Methylocaldum szegediense]